MRAVRRIGQHGGQAGHRNVAVPENEPMKHPEYPIVKSSHVVPATYLRGFADEHDRIGVRVPGKAEPHVMDVKNAGTRTKFHVRRRPDGTEIHDIEWSLSHIEDAAGPVLRSLAEAWSLDDDDRAGKRTLAELFAIQLLRGPRWIEWHEEFTWRQIEEWRAHGEPQDELELMEKWLLSDTQTFVKMIDLSRKALTIFASMKWTLLDFPRPWLATSDHPIVTWPLGVTARKPEATPHGGGLVETLEYRVPVAPRCAILMTWADGRDTRATAQKHDAASLNVFTVAEASPQWFHPPGVSPPMASGSLLPLSPTYVDGYTHDVARASARRARASEILQQKIGKDTFADKTTEIVIPVDPQAN